MILVGERLHAQTSFYGQRVDFYLASYGRDGKPRLATDIKFTETEEGSLQSPSFSIPLDQAQEFFEELWAQGFRSKHDKGNSEALDAARREHIGDLRKAAKLA